MLFGCSIMDNILYGRSTATEEEAIAAAKSACAHDFVLELPQAPAPSLLRRRGIADQAV